MYSTPVRLLSLAILAAVLSACGGRSAHPVLTMQMEDEGKTCETLSAEIRRVEYQITLLQEEKHAVIRGNILKGIFGGLTLGVSLLFIDVSNATQAELTAMYKRKAHLKDINSAKCDKDSF